MDGIKEPQVRGLIFVLKVLENRFGGCQEAYIRCRNPNFAKAEICCRIGAQMAPTGTAQAPRRPTWRPRAPLGHHDAQNGAHGRPLGAASLLWRPKWRPDGARGRHTDHFPPFLPFLCFPYFLILVLCFHDLFECFLPLTYKRLILEVASQSSQKDE